MSDSLTLSGRARRFGDDISSDLILPASRRRLSTDPVELRRHLFEAHDPAFASSIRDGDILVAGRHFGSGSVTELVVAAILCAGIRAVVAESYARSFLRSALNSGLLATCAPTADVAEGDLLSLSEAPDGEIELRTARLRIACEPMSPFVRAMLQAGGIVPFLRAHGSFGPALPGERS